MKIVDLRDQRRRKVLAISGSLRASSTNSALLRAAAILAPPDMEIIFFQGLGDLPIFNPDIDPDCAPDSVMVYRHLLQSSDGVLIASPEYAHGVSGAMKNALDWVVASGEFVAKPVALFNASPRATTALASLADTLNIMGAALIGKASISLQIIGSGLDEEAIASHNEFAGRISSALKSFSMAIG